MPGAGPTRLGLARLPGPQAGPGKAGRRKGAPIGRGLGPARPGPILRLGLPLLLTLLLDLGCGKKPEAGPALPAGPPARPGAPSQEEALAAFQDPGRPDPDRVSALVRLRTLALKNPETYRRLYASLGGLLGAEVSRVDGLSLSALEQEACLEAAAWMADFQDPGVRVKIEFYLDRETVKRKRLPEELLRGFALLLGKYPANADSRDVLWSAFQDPRELPPIRAASMKALEAFFPKDLEDRILRLAPEAGDRWLRDLQKTLLK